MKVPLSFITPESEGLLNIKRGGQPAFTRRCCFVRKAKMPQFKGFCKRVLSKTETILIEDSLSGDKDVLSNITSKSLYMLCPCYHRFCFSQFILC